MPVADVLDFAQCCPSTPSGRRSSPRDADAGPFGSRSATRPSPASYQGGLKHSCGQLTLEQSLHVNLVSAVLTGDHGRSRRGGPRPAEQRRPRADADLDGGGRRPLRGCAARAPHASLLRWTRAPPRSSPSVTRTTPVSHSTSWATSPRYAGLPPSRPGGRRGGSGGRCSVRSCSPCSGRLWRCTCGTAATRRPWTGRTCATRTCRWCSPAAQRSARKTTRCWCCVTTARRPCTSPRRGSTVRGTRRTRSTSRPGKASTSRSCCPGRSRARAVYRWTARARSC